MLPNFFKPKVQIPMVRVGSYKDGGYFIPRIIIKASKKIISCGLGEDWSFEENFLNRNKNVKILFYDHSMGALFWFKYTLKATYFFLRYRSSLKNIFKFFNYLKFLKNKQIKHFRLKISEKTSFNKKKISLNDILKNEKDLILKIDIEGDEYKILKQIILHQKKINCLIIEFHAINKNLNKIQNFLKKINQLKNCNISPNNSTGMDKFKNPFTVEIVFINKNFLKNRDYSKKVNILYQPNNPYKENIEIKFFK